MNILITGGTGFIGQKLCQSWSQSGAALCVLTRDIERAKRRLPFKDIRLIKSLSELSQSDSFDAAVNLAGAPIVQRWTKKYKEILKKSRIDLTHQLIETFSRLAKPPKVLVSGSAIGFYGPKGNEALSETDPATPSFSHELCSQWEQAALKAKELGVRVCLSRTGIVLGPHGGALQRMRLPFLLGMGGPIGRGDQWMSWVHIDDIVRVIQFCCQNEKIEGPVNATAPSPVTNKTFAKTYAHILNRPAFLTTPAFPLKIFFGQMAEELLLTGQKVVPTKLLEQGFTYLYPELQQALQAVEKK